MRPERDSRQWLLGPPSLAEEGVLDVSLPPWVCVAPAPPHPIHSLPPVSAGSCTLAVLDMQAAV